MRVPSGIAGCTYLMAFDRERDRMGNRMWLGYALRAAALADLVIGGQLVDEGGRAVAVENARPPLDPVLVAVLADAHGRRWRDLAGRRRREIENAVAAQLDAAGYIRVDRASTVWRRSRIALRDPRTITRLSDRVAATVRGSTPIARVAPADVALIAILSVADIKTGITKVQRREYADRIAAAVVAAGAPVEGLKQAIRHARSSIS